MVKVIKLDGGIGDPDLSFYCPGCKCNHGVWLKKEGYSGPSWSFNGDMDKPTFSPSILVRWVDIPEEPELDGDGNYVLGPDGRLKGAKDMVCHSFVRDGMIQFLSDCTHDLRGQTVELPEIE